MEERLLSIKSAYYAKPFDKFYLLNTDTTPVIRPHSPSLEDESYVHIPNTRIKGNRPVDIGYDYSIIGLSARRPLYKGVEASWNLPLSVRRMLTKSVRGTSTAEQVNDWQDSPDECKRFGTQLSNGRKVIVEVCSWENRLIRTKRGKSMKDKSFRLISIRLLDGQTQEAFYKNRMWLGVWGKRGKELDLEEIYWCYRNRFDIEHFFRFSKQRLLLDKYQTPDVEHLDNWMEIVNLAYWMLWVAKEESQPCVNKWQKYDPYYKNRVKYNLSPSPSEVQRQLATIILSFNQEPFIPKLKIKSKGRQKGDLQPKRKRYEVVYKGKKKPKERV